MKCPVSVTGIGTSNVFNLFLCVVYIRYFMVYIHFFVLSNSFLNNSNALERTGLWLVRSSAKNYSVPASIRIDFKL